MYLALRIASGGSLLAASCSKHRGSITVLGTSTRSTSGLRCRTEEEVEVAHTPQNHERYADVHYALNNGFKRARRQLQDQVRRLQGHVKAHETQPAGTVKQLRDGFGFLETDDGREIYFHRNSLRDEGFAYLRVGFFGGSGRKGPAGQHCSPAGQARFTLTVPARPIKLWAEFNLSGTLSANSASQTLASRSEGARQSPRGDSEPPEEIFGPFGSAERLNWLAKKRGGRPPASA